MTLPPDICQVPRKLFFGVSRPDFSAHPASAKSAMRNRRCPRARVGIKQGQWFFHVEFFAPLRDASYTNTIDACERVEHLRGNSTTLPREPGKKKDARVFASAFQF
jgi:hypothetical protein